jgi:hypothetical protein
MLVPFSLPIFITDALVLVAIFNIVPFGSILFELTVSAINVGASNKYHYAQNWSN